MQSSVDIKQLSGFLNTDDSNENIGATHHKDARNIRFRGEGNNMRPEGILGTNLITNNLPAGHNEPIGKFYDFLKGRIFWFNFNSNGNHAIYQYTIATGLIVPVVLVGTQTDGDILGFTLDGHIYAVKMLYGDETQGDALYFNNSQKQPCQINIDRALSGGYGTIKRSYIDVIKAPSKMPPAVVYENDSTVTVNNLRKKLFRFRTRPVYADKTKGVWSSESAMPLPINYADTAIDKDPTKNCRIAIVIPTGEADVIKIEIAAIIQPDIAVQGAEEPIGYFTIKVVDKAAEGVASNDLYIYRYYNNQAYLPIDPVESIQLQDEVPLQANDLEFLNGNVPIYAGILEGFNQTAILGSTTSSSESERTTQPPYIFVATQSGDSGFGTVNIHSIVLGTPAIGDIFNIYTTNQTITFACTVATTTNVIAGLAAAAIVAGFTVVSSGAENLVIIKSGESLQRVLSTPTVRAVTDSFVYDRNARYSLAVTYFDAAGRTIGAETNVTLPVQTINYTETTGIENIPKILLSISNRPPLHAHYFQLARTKNLSKLSKLEWVSDRTFKDTQFAYISIENLNRYIVDNPTSKFLQYDFSAQDRIRFMKRLSGGANTIYTDQDFEIQAQVLSPVINGIVQEGQFLKIVLPAITGTFDFGSINFNNYFIELYTPAQSVAQGLDKYYEFGERYTIGNRGTNLAYHQGMLQNQTSDLVTPATFQFDQGDYFYRPRTINTGGDLNYIITPGERGAGRCTLGMDFVDRNFTDANILTGNSPLQNLSGFNIATNNDRWIIKIVTGTYTFRIKGTITVDPEFPDVADLRLQDNTGLVTYLIQPQAIGDNNQVFSFDTTFQLTSGQRVFIFYNSVNDFTDSKQFSQTDIKITVQQPYTVGVIDPNFSDFFQSAVNSNGRPSIVEENASQVYNPTLLRWGLAYQPNTNINQTNRFREINFDEIDRSFGDIWRLKVRERILRVFQSRKVGQMGVYAKFIQDSGGNQILTTTDEIITKNNVNYYDGDFGLGDQPTGLVSSKQADYFADPVRGYLVRLSGDGNIPISEIYKGQFQIQPLLPPYSQNYLKPNGARARILGYYDYFEEEWIIILQGGTLNGKTIPNVTLSWNEKRNSFCTYSDIYAEEIISAQDKTYSWKNGQLWIHDDEVNRAVIYGIKYPISITLVFNKDIAIRKKYLSLGYQSNQVFSSPIIGDITTSMTNEQTGLPQISQLLEQDITLEENIRTAAFLYDANSRIDAREGLNNGDFLGGNWLEIKLVYSGNKYGWLFLPYVVYEISNRNF